VRPHADTYTHPTTHTTVHVDTHSHAHTLKHKGKHTHLHVRSSHAGVCCRSGAVEAHMHAHTCARAGGVQRVAGDPEQREGPPGHQAVEAAGYGPAPAGAPLFFCAGRGAWVFDGGRGQACSLAGDHQLVAHMLGSRAQGCQLVPQHACLQSLVMSPALCIQSTGAGSWLCSRTLQKHVYPRRWKRRRTLPLPFNPTLVLTLTFPPGAVRGQAVVAHHRQRHGREAL